MAAVPSKELRTVLSFKFRNRSTCSKGPMKSASKVCGDSQDLKSPGSKPATYQLHCVLMDLLESDVIITAK